MDKNISHFFKFENSIVFFLPPDFRNTIASLCEAINTQHMHHRCFFSGVLCPHYLLCMHQHIKDPSMQILTFDTNLCSSPIKYLC